VAPLARQFRLPRQRIVKPFSSEMLIKAIHGLNELGLSEARLVECAIEDGGASCPARETPINQALP